MAKTNAEIQRDYKLRTNLLKVSFNKNDDTIRKLEILAMYKGKTKKDMLAEIVDWHYRALERKLERERGHSDAYWADKIEQEYANLTKEN